MPNHSISRRQFLATGLGATALAGGSVGFLACTKTQTVAPLTTPSRGTAFPVLQVEGTPMEIGLATGKRFGAVIRTGLKRRSAWFADLQAFARGEGKDAFDALCAAAKKHAPGPYDELMGVAEGAALEAHDLLVLNLKAELEALKRVQQKNQESEETPGCSTIVLATEDNLIHIQNEDGNSAYRDLMYVLKSRYPEGPNSVVLTYPGILSGNGPGINSHGITQTTNYIASNDVGPGVGRYFLARLAMNAKSISEAEAIASHAERAFAFHHVFSKPSTAEAISVEVSPTQKVTRQINGLFFHTNHLIYDDIKNTPQDEEYVNSSSLSRWNVIEDWASNQTSIEKLSRVQLLEPLSSHKGAPFSPCRHPKGDVHGYTLGTAIFEHPQNHMDLSFGQPCKGPFKTYRLD